MRKSMIIGTLIELERLNNSVWGSPRYRVIIKDECGGYFYAKTSSNESCCYSISNYYGKKRVFYYHSTKVGNNIIDDIDPIV